MNIFEGTIGKTAGGMALTAFDRQMQMQNAEKMHEMQIAGSKEMGQFNQGLAIDTWAKTASPQAQTANMREAGLNTGLMYSGAGGGGGATTQAGSVPSQHIDQQPLGMSMQQVQGLQIGKAQKENIEADTEKKKVETEKTAGIDTTKAETENQILEYRKDIEEIEAQSKEMTQRDVINEVHATSNKAVWEYEKAKADGTIAKETADEKIKQIEQQSVEQALRIAGQKQGLQMSEQQMKKVAQEIYQLKGNTEYRERDMTLREKQQIMQKLQQEFNTSDAAQIKQWTSIVTDILQSTKSGHKTVIDKSTHNNNWE
jgi:hypothetical protein